MATFQFAIPFTADTARLSNAAFNAINQALDLYLYSGNYTINTAATYLALRDIGATLARHWRTANMVALRSARRALELVVNARTWPR